MEKSEMSIADIVTNEEDKKILEPVKAKKKRIVIGTVTCDSLFLRAEPDKESDILYIMPKGERVALMDGDTADFYKVTVNGVTGYCVKEFVTI